MHVNGTKGQNSRLCGTWLGLPNHEGCLAAYQVVIDRIEREAQADLIMIRASGSLVEREPR